MPARLGAGGQTVENAMGTDARPQERRALCSFRKVSKPLMEKKRRARINLSLEQLKSLLEKHYSHQIQKRKLEKADILELSVKYMKSLQHSAQGPPMTLKTADYQAGFRSCLQGVRQFLLSSEVAGEASASSLRLLHQLARALPLGSAGNAFSTVDSAPQPALRPMAPQGMVDPGSEQDSVPWWGGWSQARSERGPSGQRPRERSQQLWRPW